MTFSETLDLDTPISEADLEFIEDVLLKYGNDDSVLDICELDGFLTALVSGPEMIPPSRWFSALWGGPGNEPEWQSEEEMQRFTALLFQLMNSNAMMLVETPAEFSALFRITEREGEAPFAIVEEWCFGYMRGVDLGQWPNLPAELDTQLQAIALHGREEHFDHLGALTDAEHQHSITQIEPAARALHRHWLQQRAPELSTNSSPHRADPKTGRNDPCPCGSGKKFKRCCLH
ncbi:YecA family protein [Microbulbifer sp. EKSA008]|uniref:YecA/YgfB family protein n=1 Tax=Microbulbifer sp. EKSA008 TaxID=3243367 RepID=UPI004041AFED